MFSVYIVVFPLEIFCADVGNRITELGKVVGHLHGEMKQINQTLLDIEENRLDPSERSTSSIIGRYIQGAKNNFRDFNSSILPSESKSTPLLANVQNPKSEDAGDVNEEETQDPAETVDRGKMEEEGAGDEIREEEGNDQTVDEEETMKMEEGRANEGKEESITGSSGSQDTGFGSEESELSTSSPE